jgi:hypothetical protein
LARDAGFAGFEAADRIVAEHSRHADARLPDDNLASFSDDLAQCASLVHLPARLHRLPGNAGTIVGNDTIADHPQAGHLEFGRKLSRGHIDPLEYRKKNAATVAAIRLAAAPMQTPYPS